MHIDHIDLRHPSCETRSVPSDHLVQLVHFRDGGKVQQDVLSRRDFWHVVSSLMAVYVEHSEDLQPCIF